MAFNKRYLLAFWFMRISLLFGISGLLFSAYVHTFISPNMLKSFGSITFALHFGMFFFATIPGHRMDILYNRLEKKFIEKNEFAGTTPPEASSKNEVRSLRRFMILLILFTVFVILNFLFAVKAYAANNHPRMFIHMCIIVTASFLYNASLLMYKVDQTFKKIEGLIYKCSH